MTWFWEKTRAWWWDDEDSYEGVPRHPLAILAIDKDIPPPSRAEMARRLARDRALQRWHTDRSIKTDFEAYWKLLQQGKAA